MDKALFSKVKNIQIRTSRRVTDIFAGEYASVFKGQGMEFEEVREYTPGDEIRSIDWNVTARMDRPFVKIFREERELTVFFVVDLSSSMIFGSNEKSKQELVAEFCAVLAFAAIQNNDKVGLILFSDEIEKTIFPGKGKKHVLRVIRELLATGLEKKAKRRKKTFLSDALEYLSKIQRKKSICFLVSDFFAEHYTKPLRILSKKHDLVHVWVKDPLEYSIPSSGIVMWEDLESGARIEVDCSNTQSRKDFIKGMKSQENELREQFKVLGIDGIEISTQGDFLPQIIRFFKEREKRRRLT